LNNKILIAITLIFLSVFVNAHTLEGNFNGLTFQGETIERTFVLCNTQDSGENFSLSSDNAWMEVRPLSVYLSGESCKEVYAFITPFPYAESGEYDLGIKAKGETSTITKIFNLSVVEGHKIKINGITLINATQCQEKVFQLELENTGIFDERVILSVQGLNSNWFELSSEEILIKKNTSREVEINVLIPCNQETKEYEFNLLVELKNTGITKEKTLLLNVENGQEIQIESKNFTACNDVTKTDSITIKNNGLMEDSLTVEVQGLNWVKLKENKFNLSPGQSKAIELEFSKNDLTTQNYPLKVIVYSEKFNQYYEKNLTVRLEDCYNLSLETARWQENVCIESKPVISYIVKNNGTQKTTVKLSIQGVQAELEKNSITLEAGESTEVQATLDFSAVSVLGELKIILIADSENYSETLEKTIQREDCYGIQTEVPVIKVCREVPTQNKFISVKNTGTKTQLFNLSSNLNWIKLSEESFSLNKGEEKAVELIILPTKESTENSYTIKTITENNQYTLNAKIDYLDNTTCFGLNMTNLKKQVDVNAGEGGITTLKVTNNGMTLQKISFTVEDYPWVYFNPKEFDLGVGETKEVYVYFNPPFDFEQEQAKVWVKATTNYGFTVQEEVEVNVSGGSIILSINPEDIKVKSNGLETEDTLENTVEIKIEIENNTETSMKVLDVKSNYPETKYFIENPKIEKGTTSEILLSFVVNENMELNGLEVPIEIITDKGTYYKVVSIPEEIKTTTETEKEAEAESTGFILFGQDEYILVILIVIVVILIIMAAVRTDKEEEKAEVIDYAPENDFQADIKEIITRKPQTRKNSSNKTKKTSTRKKKK